MVPVQEILSFKVEGKAALVIVFQTTFTNTVTKVIAREPHEKVTFINREKAHTFLLHLGNLFPEKHDRTFVLSVLSL